MLLEIACFSYESALIAQEAGADRIELCENYLSGGLTPPLSPFKKLRNQIHIPLFVMIRPRSEHFEYNSEEFEQMKKEIIQFKKIGANGFVFGILNKNEPDFHRCKQLVELASPLPCTFHRAFDEVSDPLSCLERLIECGFKRILTSGKEKSALEGALLIEELILKANNRIIILPGGGIRSENIKDIKIKTGAKEFHSAAMLTNSMTPDFEEITKIKKAIDR